MASSTFARDVLNELSGLCLRRGTMDSVNRAQPEQAPGTGVTCAIWVQRIEPARGGSGLNATTVRLEYWIRLYTPTSSLPKDELDDKLMDATTDLMMALSGTFTLGGVARAIDLGGAHGTPLSMVAGYTRFPDTDVTYRVTTITCPVVVNDVWDQTG